MSDDIVERLRALCVGRLHAKIAWPHRELHEAISEIERLREALRQVAQFRGQLNPKHFGIDNNFATAVAIAEFALSPAKDTDG